MVWKARKYFIANKIFLASTYITPAYAVLCICLILATSSCKKDGGDVFVSNVDRADTVWVDTSTTGLKNDFQQLLDTLTTAPTEFTIGDIKKNQTFNPVNGITVDLPSRGFNQKSGKDAEGPAIATIIFLGNRGEMIKNKISGISSDKALKTAFAIKIAFYQDGEELELARNKEIDIFINKENPETGLRLYTDQQGSNLSNWVAFSDGDITSVSRNSKKGYELELEQLPWILAGEAFNAANTTTITATLPNIFTNANSKVYILLNDRNGLLEMRQEKNSKSFFADNIPDGSTAKIISVSSISNTFYLGIEDLEIKKKQHIKLKPGIISYAELNAFMKGLN